MMPTDYREELAAQWRLARDKFPAADHAEITQEIMRNLDDDELLAHASDMLSYWGAEPPGDRRAMAENHILNFVIEMETSPGDDEDGEQSR